MPPEHPLDRIDRAILAALQNDGRLSNKELAAEVGLAPSSCLQRVRRLRAAGVLLGFRADVDPAALGIALQAMVSMRLAVHSRDAWDAVSERVSSMPEVVAAYQLSGGDDFLVHVAVRDAAHLRTFVMDSISSLPGVAHVQTSLIFDVVRAGTLPDYSQ